MSQGINNTIKSSNIPCISFPNFSLHLDFHSLQIIISNELNTHSSSSSIGIAKILHLHFPGTFPTFPCLREKVIITTQPGSNPVNPTILLNPRRRVQNYNRIKHQSLCSLTSSQSRADDFHFLPCCFPLSKCHHTLRK